MVIPSEETVQKIRAVIRIINGELELLRGLCSIIGGRAGRQFEDAIHNLEGAAMDLEQALRRIRE